MRAIMRRLRALSASAVLMLGACSLLSVPMNEPLHSVAGNTEYRLLDVNRAGGAESALVLVALSGGGKRSAAFGQGVLRGMRDIHVRPERKDSTLLATNDRMTQVYDRLMFRGATFADLARRGRPQVSINATDISFGLPFGFLPQTFDVICSDLAGVPVARAVAASNGFPVLFGPVTLRNYRGPDCPLPSAVSQAAWERAENDLRARTLLEAQYRYSDPEQVRWIHLMDGGISDNLALRVLLNDMLLMETPAERVTAGLMPVRRVLVISVDGQAAPNPAWPQQRTVSGLGQIISAATGAQIGAYNLETLIAIKHTVDDVVEELRQMRCRRGRIIMGYRCDDVAGEVLRVSLSDYDDPETRARLLAIRTGLTLPREQVDELVAAGGAMIRRNAGAIAGFLEPGRQAAVMARRK